jgi:hypothetical protein
VYETAKVALSEAQAASAHSIASPYELIAALPGTVIVCEPSFSSVLLLMTLPSSAFVTVVITDAHDEPSPR